HAQETRDVTAVRHGRHPKKRRSANVLARFGLVVGCTIALRPHPWGDDLRNGKSGRSLGWLGAPFQKLRGSSAPVGTQDKGHAQRTPLRDHTRSVWRALLRASANVLALAAPLALIAPAATGTQRSEEDSTPIVSRNVGMVRAGAAERPRSEGDQALVNGW